jgi:hypothetical protein
MKELFLFQSAPRQRMPDFIILEVDAPGKDFLSRLRDLDNMVPDKDDLRSLEYFFASREVFIAMVLETLTYEKDAILELSYRLMEEVQGAMGSMPSTKEVDLAAEAIVTFGSSLYEELRRMRIYRNGYLPYQFARWLGNDLILQRLDVYPPNL